MRILKCLCLLFMIGALGLTPVLAQSVDKPAETAFQPNDPIVEMLDSLVTLNHVIRYNNLTTHGQGVTSRTDLPYYSDDIYRQRMSQLYSPIPLEYNDEVKKYIELYAYRKRELTSRMMGLSQLYFPLFEEILDQEGLPLEFKYLSIVESALNPVAVSRMGATGLWQFMYNTGKLYKLEINSFYDERRDPVKSTYAACQYFKDMYAIYGDWLLVIASYNCGPGNVNKAIKRAGGNKNFWEIAKFLPAETRGYVPAFVAVTYLMNHTDEHQIFPVMPAYNYFEVDTVSIDRGITLRKIADAIDLPIEVVTYLNPLYKKGVIPDTKEPNYLRLPSAKLAAYLAAETTLFDPLVVPVPSATAEPLFVSTNSGENETGAFKYESKKVKKIYTVRSGENLSVISKKLSCTVNELKTWNKLRSNLLMKGQRLSYYAIVKVKVPLEKKAVSTTSVEEQKQDVADANETAKAAVTPSGKPNTSPETIYHMVQKGDTLWKIAQRYEGVTVEQIMKINSISNSKSLMPGTKLKVKVNG
ncbi:MAG: transglycosylase SLT domain-containing protein [Bacteroidota bacterium]|nr:transglycosylase SLT domain-containing protein [Bacteroidota bacterium]